MLKQMILVVCLILPWQLSTSQAFANPVHTKVRTLRYTPDEGEFVIKNGQRRFNRALYGSNTPFRVETGDLPEIAMYLPGVGGNFKIGIASGGKDKWITEAQTIIARYSPGKMTYLIEDSLLGKGTLTISVLALYEKEGFIIKIESKNAVPDLEIYYAYGGITGDRLSRDGDLNCDPESSFYLLPSYCADNRFEINNNNFKVSYVTSKMKSEAERYEIAPNGVTSKNALEKISEKNKNALYLSGFFPENAELKVGDATALSKPSEFYSSVTKSAPALCVRHKAKEISYCAIFNQQESGHNYHQASGLYADADNERNAIANRIKVDTPDPFINNLSGLISMAGDAIWEYPTFLHGAVGWRMRLNGWRGPYTGDALGWHDRARIHFDAYALSQLSYPESGPNVPDPAKNLARQQPKIGNSIYTSGYICRNPGGVFETHHYDMNLVFVDAMLRHFKWTGDTSYVKKMWPVLTKHLAWEKRNFDGNNDGLYDAYCCIWASDALQYSGGGVTHSSAYNYFSNRMAAELAPLIGENPEPYQQEASKIKQAMNSHLWLPTKGWYAEYKDLLGLQRVHPSAALWTIYHSIDSEVPDAFKAFQLTRYVDTEIPRIPIKAARLKDEGYYTISTTNWMPYEWSINNVVPVENFHTSLAYWQAGRANDAFKLWKSSILDAMYLGSSPGNFLLISSYDANRGEVYRDFADCVGMASRSLVEGLFGITPDLINNTVTIRPGLPKEWDHASISTPDISFKYKAQGSTDNYSIEPRFRKAVKLRLLVTAKKDRIASVKVNGKPSKWKNVPEAINNPQIEIQAEPASAYEIEIVWQGHEPATVNNPEFAGLNEKLTASFGNAGVVEVFDPQTVLQKTTINKNKFTALVTGEKGSRTVFAKVKQGDFTWWIPVCVTLKEAVEISYNHQQPENELCFTIKNNTSASINANVSVNPGKSQFSTNKTIAAYSESDPITINSKHVVSGSNLVKVSYGNNKTVEKPVVNWNLKMPDATNFEIINISNHFNDFVTQIFKNKYLSPRSPYPTLSIPTQGIGNWCYPAMMANIDDSGLRRLSGISQRILTPHSIPFTTPSDSASKNILFTSQWDNYPVEVPIKLTGKASHAYLLMAGSTNYMQSRITNGYVTFEYTDGSKSELELVNPETWCPIERDYYVDGFAFKISTPRPPRLMLKYGTFGFNSSDKNAFGGKKIDGGAATVLDLPLNPLKELKSVTLKTASNEVVIGLMAITLVR